MIISALNRYYEILAGDEDSGIALNGFSYAKPAFECNIDRDAKLTGIVSLETAVSDGKKEVKVLKRILVPQQEIKSSGIKSNFLCENAGYVFGLYNPSGDELKTEKQIADSMAKAPKRLDAFRQLHREVLGSTDNAYGRMFLKFLDEYDYETYKDIIEPLTEDLNKGGTIVFRVDGVYLHEIEDIKKAWLAYCDKQKEGSVKMQCAVSGERAGVATLHPFIKGVRDAQSSGASMVSFNAASYESYNKSQGLNAPVSERVTFNYTTVLNHLLASKDNRIQLGDATTVFWAESAQKDYVDYINILLNPPAAEKETDGVQAVETEGKIKALLEAYRSGTRIDYAAFGLSPDTKTYILGLSPNASRLSVRFFYADTFASVMDKMMAHYKDLAIEKTYDRQFDVIPAWMLIKETANPKGGDINPLLSGSFTRSILTGAMYPRLLFTSIINRVRCDRDDEKNTMRQINYVRASIIKAYLSRYARKTKQDTFKEVLTMSLNETATNVPYLLGRLFAVLEKAQRDANPGINATIKDRYFSSACATPSAVFPTLLKLAQSHMAKSDYGIVSEKRISEILNKIEGPGLPAHLSLEDQGIFILGYYHQNNALYKKSE